VAASFEQSRAPGDGSASISEHSKHQNSTREIQARRAMTIQAARISPDPLDVFRERCEARAYLVEIGELAFLDAVDVLQTAAEFDGLIDQFGQDVIQEIMATAFGAAR
jgi:hypothetical protein